MGASTAILLYLLKANGALLLLAAAYFGLLRRLTFFTLNRAYLVLAGELSLGAAISSSDWVSSHEQYGRNR